MSQFLIHMRMTSQQLENERQPTLIDFFHGSPVSGLSQFVLFLIRIVFDRLPIGKISPLFPSTERAGRR